MITEELKEINRLQTAIIITSHAYYELSRSLMTDFKYDLITKNYLELIKGVDISTTKYAEAFYDFDGSTGFDLFSKLSSNTKMTIRILTQRMVKFSC